jgi:DNA-directed RNA polymerase specialized sigma24 family protein
MDETPMLEDVARRALDGDPNALDLLVRALQGDVHGLALRMLWNREDAEDATQEILVRVITQLSHLMAGADSEPGSTASPSTTSLI